MLHPSKSITAEDTCPEALTAVQTRQNPASEIPESDPSTEKNKPFQINFYCAIMYPHRRESFVALAL